jgi:ribosomal protein S18 acetylase RimI-like enzyme
VDTIDVVGRGTAQVAPAPAERYELRRLATLDPVLATAPGDHEGVVGPLLDRWTWLDDRGRRARLRRFGQRFAKGDIAYLAVQDGQAVAWTWVSRAPAIHCHWSGLRFHFAPDEAYVYDLWCSPEHRRHGAAAFVMRGALSDLAARGEARQVYGFVLRDNRPSQVLHRLVLGFEQVQEVQDLRVLGRRGVQLPGTLRPRRGPCVPGLRVLPFGPTR